MATNKEIKIIVHLINFCAALTVISLSNGHRLIEDARFARLKLRFIIDLVRCNNKKAMTRKTNNPSMFKV